MFYVTRKEGLTSLALMAAGGGAILLGLFSDLFQSANRNFGPNDLVLSLSGLPLFLAGMLVAFPVFRRPLVEGLLVMVGAVAVAFTADVLFVGGLADSIAKQSLLLCTLAAVAAVQAAPRLAKSESLWQSALSLDVKRVATFVLLVGELGLLVLIIRYFELENPAFRGQIMPLVFFGFVVHYFLPLRHRKGFFLMLSVLAFVGILGWTNATILIVLGLALIALCHLPVKIGLRVALLVVIGATLVLARSQILPFPEITPIWPILGSVFMFRLLIYLYDLQHAPKKPGWLNTVSYFFLLPNTVFLLFPVIDFSTFQRSYYNEEEHRIYQRGIKWIFWGVGHLLLYRFIQLHLYVPPESVQNLSDLFMHVVPNFLLLLQISGQFHLIIGILLLFGFNLPRVFNRFFLAPGYAEFWRRANIYWKDFMIKVFYYPCYFWARAASDLQRLVIATVFVFVATWFLHAYQWYWLRGSILLSGPDVIFWTAFGLLVLVSSLHEARKGNKKTLGETNLTFRKGVSRILRVTLTFFSIAILYSLWTSPSVPEWLALWKAGLGGPWSSQFLVFLFATLGILAAAALWDGFKIKTRISRPQRFSFQGHLFSTTAPVVLLFLMTTPVVQGGLDERTQRFLTTLKGSYMTEEEADLLLRGYYENLTEVSQMNSQLWEIYSKRPAEWPLIQETAAARLTDKFISMELQPLTRINFHGAPLSINKWGMRDRDYEKIPTPGTFRIALLGPSFVMGSGVADHEVFDEVLEKRLTREGGTVEILNFAVPSFSILEELATLESKALSFSPNAVFLISHDFEESILVRNLAGKIQSAIPLEYDFLEEVVRRAGISKDMSQHDLERALKPYGPEILEWAYQSIADLCRARDIVALWIYLPSLERAELSNNSQQLARIAEQAGFVSIDLSALYEGQDLKALRVAEWDRHPNARGHRLIADGIYQALKGMHQLPGLESITRETTNGGGSSN